MAAVINFYRVHEAYGEFSNFAPYPLEIDGKRWPTSEHYFQSQKFAGTPHEEEIRLAASPSLAKRMGRDRSRPLRPDWERVKEDIMREALRAKFTQHETLRERLLATGDALLVEHTKNDAYWGDGGDGTGLNRLGKLLMALRQELRPVFATDAQVHRPCLYRLFVYGTLAPGRPNAHVLADVPGSWEPASVTGTLLNAGWGATAGFPGIVLDDQGEAVQGFLFSSEELAEHWARLDAFEGAGYVRVRTRARCQDGSIVDAYIYELNKSALQRNAPTGR